MSTAGQEKLSRLRPFRRPVLKISPLANAHHKQPDRRPIEHVLTLLIRLKPMAEPLAMQPRQIQFRLWSEIDFALLPLSKRIVSPGTDDQPGVSPGRLAAAAVCDRRVRLDRAIAVIVSAANVQVR